MKRREAKKQRKKGKIYPFECRDPKNSKEREESLPQWSVKRKETKTKGEKQRYTHLKAEFQRIARRDKKAILSDQCKEIEENNRMGKTRDLFKKIRDTKGKSKRVPEKHLFLLYWLCQSLWLCGSQ